MSISNIFQDISKRITKFNFSSHMGGMGTHPLGSPMSSYYGAGMSSMAGLTPNFGMYSSQSPMSMGMSSSMSGLGTVTSMASQSSSSVSAYPSSSSPYPGDKITVSEENSFYRK